MSRIGAARLFRRASPSLINDGLATVKAAEKGTTTVPIPVNFETQQENGISVGYPPGSAIARCTKPVDLRFAQQRELWAYVISSRSSNRAAGHRAVAGTV